MCLFDFSKRMLKSRKDEKRVEKIQSEGEKFKLAGNFTPALIVAVVVLALAICNVGLFLTVIKPWYRWVFALLAVMAEALLGYSIHSFLYTAGKHKVCCAICGFLLLTFSLIHGGFFRFNLLMGGPVNPAIMEYAHKYSWLVLSALIIGCGLALWLTHWSADVASEEATERVETAKSKAKLVGESTRLQLEADLERMRIEHMKEEIKLGNESAALILTYAEMRARQQESLERIPDEQLRAQLASDFGVTLKASGKKDVITWQGGRRVSQMGN